MLLRHASPFLRGTTPLVVRGGETADALMDLSAIVLAEGDTVADESATDERAFLLTSGSARLSWNGSVAGVSRGNLLDDRPWTLLVPRGTRVAIEAGTGGAELYRVSTPNPKEYAARLFAPEECRSELRGTGIMNDAAERIARTVFDDSNMKESMLVLGEVVHKPGKWSSFPPHHHPQPELYHYRFFPARGFGFTAVGETPYLLRDRDTTLMVGGVDHPQVTAPGYAMWYLWVIRHLENNRYSGPAFTEEHRWAAEPDAPIWASKNDK